MVERFSTEISYNYITVCGNPKGIGKAALSVRLQG